MGATVQSSGDIDTAFLEGEAIVAVGLKRSFSVGEKRIDVLRDISVTIPFRERLFLCGPSGAGKTTLLYTLAGLERPEAGTVRIGDQSLYALSPKQQAKVRNGLMGYIFQNYFLLPELTALENVLLPSQIGGGMQRDRARRLLDQVGLSERVNHLPAELSGGEQQRVAIARALVNDPRIIFADEPTGNLDSKTGGGVMELLLSIVAETHKTLVVVTHDMKLAALGDRTLILRDGRFEA
jgi:putative ABC transport system ATP-binding protein/lipoprotein-releasing system ATP-binding protein